MSGCLAIYMYIYILFRIFPLRILSINIFLSTVRKKNQTIGPTKGPSILDQITKLFLKSGSVMNIKGQKEELTPQCILTGPEYVCVRVVTRAPVREQKRSQYERKSGIGAVTLRAGWKEGGRKRDGWTPLNRSLREKCLGYCTSSAISSGDFFLLLSSKNNFIHDLKTEGLLCTV